MPKEQYINDNPCKSHAVYNYQPKLFLTLEPFKMQKDSISMYSGNVSPDNNTVTLVEIKKKPFETNSLPNIM